MAEELFRGVHGALATNARQERLDIDKVGTTGTRFGSRVFRTFFVDCFYLMIQSNIRPVPTWLCRLLPIQA